MAAQARKRNLLKLAAVALMSVLILIVLPSMWFTRESFRGPTFNGDYDRVINLIQEGKIQVHDVTVRLPRQYRYLSARGTIAVLTTENTLIVFFHTEENEPPSIGDTLNGYLYKSDDEQPESGDFFPYADDFDCKQIRPHWFDCIYSVH